MLAAREAAEAASRAKSEFLSSMSHEIRTPMNAILGMAEVLAESSLTDEQHKYLRIMINNGGSLLDLINDILDFALVESGRLKLERTSFDLSEVVERVAETLSIRAHQKRLELVVDIAPATPATVIGDPLRLRQVLINLIGNAIKFTEEGEIELKVAPADDSGTLHFSVRDTGIGIPADQLEEIFKGYTQAETSTARKFGGTGLGLAIVKQLSDLMGGRVWVESEIGRGTTFHFLARFNLHAEHARTNEAAPSLHGIKVLVVDDSAASRNALARLLAYQGAMVMTVGSGPEAMAWMFEPDNRDSVILLDCRMTPTDGYETARRMQAAGLDTTKVIPMVTADDLNLKLPLLRKLGLLRHLIKPVRRGELTAAIQSVAGPVGSTAPVAMNAAPIVNSAVQAAPARSPAPTPLSGVPAASSLGRPMRVLVADDSEDNRLLIDAFLKKTGYAVDHADNGEIAVQKFLENHYDVVLMDIQMPVMDGYQAVRQIRDWEETQGAARTPVIALTASVLDEAVGKSFEAGCDTHVSKPVRRSTLLTAIHEVVTVPTPGDDQAAAG
jgi:CheY-like chemotaxis protein